MFDKRSDYALNHLDKTAIVCQSVIGEHIRLTCGDFTSEEEFLQWKSWFDDDYHKIQLAGMMTAASRLMPCGIPQPLPQKTLSLHLSWPQKKQSGGNGYWSKSGQSSPPNSTVVCACTIWRERRRRKSLLQKGLPSSVSPSP